MKLQLIIRNLGSSTRHPSYVLWCVLLICAVIFLSFGTASSIADTSKIEDAKTSLEKWVETQRIISQEKHDLALAKEMLTERVELIQREIESLHLKIGEANEGIAEADKKRAEMIEENEKLKIASIALGNKAKVLEDGIRQFLRRLPDPIRDRVKPLSQRLPNNVDQTKLSVAEHFQNIVGILNEVDKFNREVSVTSEVRTLSDGSSVEVATLYLGVGQAYYAGGANGKIAGTGTASDDSWIWKPENTAASQIADAIAVFKNEKVASFVLLPIEIK